MRMRNSTSGPIEIILNAQYTKLQVSAAGVDMSIGLVVSERYGSLHWRWLLIDSCLQLAHHEVLLWYSEILTITQVITSCSFSVMNVDFISEITGLGVTFTVHLTQTDS